MFRFFRLGLKSIKKINTGLKSFSGSEVLGLPFWSDDVIFVQLEKDDDYCYISRTKLSS